MTTFNRLISLTRQGLPAAICLVVAFTLGLARVASERIYSDEHLFLGGAGLMARGDGLIYRDFFYNHMPTQALAAALLFQITDYWTLAARVLDAACGAMLATLLFVATRRAVGDALSALWRNAAATGVVAIFLFNPATADALGKAWNHDLAALACVGSILVLSTGVARAKPIPWAVLSGALAGIAVTTRLTYVPPTGVIPLLILLAPGFGWRTRIRLLIAWCVGGLIGAAPALWVCLQDVAAAYFGNFQFPHYSALYHVEAGGPRRGPRRLLTSTKIRFLRETYAASWPLMLFAATTLIAILAAWRPWRSRASLPQARLTCCVLMLAAAWAAAFAPTPMFHQYLYGPLPFAALAIAWSLHGIGLPLRYRRIAVVIVVVIAAACVMLGRSSYTTGLAMLHQPERWAPVAAHADSRRLASLVESDGPVLTFAPGIPLEAGLPIYPEMSIGRYAIRMGYMLNAKQRRTLHIPNVRAMNGWFESNPPSAVLLVEPRVPLERAAADAAEAHGYRRVSFGRARVVYLRTAEAVPASIAK